MQYSTVGADEESGARGEAAASKNPVGTRHASIGIAQNGIIDAQRLGKLAARLSIADADSVVTSCKHPDGAGAPAHRVTLDRASAGERFRKPGQHDRLPPP
jgi:hypothetical protein